MDPDTSMNVDAAAETSDTDGERFAETALTSGMIITTANSPSQEQRFIPADRRRSSVGAGSVVSNVSSVVGHGHMTELEQEERRRKIQAILMDNTLAQPEKSRAIQALMDGRPNRRCSVTSTAGASVATHSTGVHSYVSNMGPVAAAAVAGYYNHQNNASNASLGVGGGNTTTATTATSGSSSGGPPNYLHTTGTMTGKEFMNYRDDRSIASSVSTSNSAEYSSEEEQQRIQQAPSLCLKSSTVQPPTNVAYKQYHGRSLSLQDWNDTDRVTAAAHCNVCLPNDNGVARLMEQSRPPCEHYVRNCTLISPCCGLAFGCRFCHDECPVLPPPVMRQLTQRRNSSTSAVATCATATPAATPASTHHYPSKLGRRRSMPVDLQLDLDNNELMETHHLIDRHAVQEVICRLCYTRQSSKTNHCTECGLQFGEYHCSICNLWMSAKESPYHCHDCGFCRVGGRDNFRHCHDCGMCIDATLFDDHNCKSGKYMSNCPICQEDLFSSRLASHEMPCGHAIHWHCFEELLTYDTRCPVCKKTAETPEEMETAWSTLAMGIALQPVPPDLARVINLYCIDCEATEENRRWHFLGVRCNSCWSFNTNVEKIVMQGPEAAKFLDAMERNVAPVPMNITMPLRMDLGGGDGDAMDEEDDENEL